MTSPQQQHPSVDFDRSQDSRVSRKSDAGVADSFVGRFAQRHLSDAELELHIFDCERLWRMSYADFQAYGNPHDRDAALLHLHRMNEAILGRSKAIQARRHAAFEAHLTEQWAFFNSDAAVAMSRPGWRASHA